MVADLLERIPTPEPGIYPDATFREYLAWDALNRRTLVWLRETCPLKAHYALTHVREPSDVMVRGSAIHVLALEDQEAFDRSFRYGPDVRRNANAWKDFAAECREANVQPLHPVLDGEPISSTVEAIRRSEGAGRWLRCPGMNEVSFVWDEEVELPDGTKVTVRQKGRADRHIRGPQGFLGLDLKRLADASPVGMARSLTDQLLHLQAAHYLAGLEALTGEPHRLWFWAVWEESPPHAAGIYRLQEPDLVKAFEERREILTTWAECLHTDTWPGYDDAVRLTGVRPFYRFYTRSA